MLLQLPQISTQHFYEYMTHYCNFSENKCPKKND